jgi:osmotically-inducible protein OsmY
MARRGSEGQDYRSESERVKPRVGATSFNEESVPPEIRADRNLQRLITGRINLEPELVTSQVEVEVRAGVVILNGSTDTVNTKYRLEQLIKRVEGVQKIENNLKIRIGEALEEFSRNADAARLREARVRDSKRS